MFGGFERRVSGVRSREVCVPDHPRPDISDQLAPVRHGPIFENGALILEDQRFLDPGCVALQAELVL